MLESLSLIADGIGLQKQENIATLRMVKHERMAGSVPVWDHSASARQETRHTFERALKHVDAPNANTLPPSSMALSAGTPAEQPDANDVPFGFGDLFDIINPLQHLPIIGHLYREITGDEIRSTSKIMGDGLFGGVLGAATSLVNMIVEHDTGRDIPTLLFDQVSGAAKHTAPENLVVDRPFHVSENNDLDCALLAYTGRTSGYFAVQQIIQT